MEEEEEFQVEEEQSQIETSPSPHKKSTSSANFDPEMEAYLIVAMLQNDFVDNKKNQVSVIEEESESQNYMSNPSVIEPISPFEDDDTE
jgi:hypothetical protein